MDNLNNRDIYSDDDWQSLSTPVIRAEDSEPQNEIEETITVSKPKKINKHPVLTIQLTISLCVLLFIFVVKFMSTTLFERIMAWYDYEISKSVVYNFDFESLDFSSLFATSDES